MAGCCGGSSGSSGSSGPENLFLVIKQGAKFSFQIAVKNKDTSPFDLTGFEGRGELRELKDKTSKLLAAFDVSFSAPPTDGIVLVTLGATVTKNLFKGGYFDIEIEEILDPDNVIRIVQGKMTLDTEVTAP